MTKRNRSYVNPRARDISRRDVGRFPNMRARVARERALAPTRPKMGDAGSAYIEPVLTSEWQFAMSGAAHTLQTPCQFDTTKSYRITASIRIDSEPPGDSELWTSQDPARPYEFNRMRPATNDLFFRRPPGPTTIPVALDWTTHVGQGFKNYEEIYDAATKQITVNWGGLSANATQASWTGSVISLLEWMWNVTGAVIRDIRIYDDADNLAHFWPVDDGPDSGGVVKDYGPAACDGNWANGTWERRIPTFEQQLRFNDPGLADIPLFTWANDESEPYKMEYEVWIDTGTTARWDSWRTTTTAHTQFRDSNDVQVFHLGGSRTIALPWQTVMAGKWSDVVEEWNPTTKTYTITVDGTPYTADFTGVSETQTNLASFGFAIRGVMRNIRYYETDLVNAKHYAPLDDNALTLQDFVRAENGSVTAVNGVWETWEAR